ncbi:MAG: hypothetical protein HY939_07485 [Gammaproteobacteria bacterium]|nr:hypothetical protein [Gammaproteobacteria bacterium]
MPVNTLSRKTQETIELARETQATIELARLNTKAENESKLSVILRFFAMMAGWLDLWGTTGGAGVKMTTGLVNATAPSSQLATDTSNVARDSSLLSALGFFLNNFLNMFRLILTGKGKENRFTTIAYSALGICGPILAGSIIGVAAGVAGFSAVLASFGFTIALLITPILGVIINASILLRNSFRLIRTYQGLEPEGLLAQKKKKREAVRDDDNDDAKNRFTRFQAECAALEWYLDSIKKTTKKERVNKADIEDEERFRKFKDATFEEKKLLDDVKKTFSLKKFISPQDFKTYLSDHPDEAAAYAISLIKAQKAKWDSRRKFFVPSTILCLTFIASCLIGFLYLLSLTMPCAFPALVAAAAGLQIAGYALGFSVLGCMTAFAAFSIQGAITQYRTWAKQYDDILEQNKTFKKLSEANQTTSAEQSKWGQFLQQSQELKSLERTSTSLKYTGAAGILVGGLITAIALMPFVNIIFLGIAGGVLAAIGTALVIASAIKAWEERNPKKIIEDLAKEKGENTLSSLLAKLSENKSNAPKPAPTTSASTTTAATRHDEPADSAASPPPDSLPPAPLVGADQTTPRPVVIRVAAAVPHRYTSLT